MTKLRVGVLACVLTLGGALLAAPAALATSATAMLSAGTLGFINSTPGAVSFAGTLTGADQTLSTTQGFQVGVAV